MNDNQDSVVYVFDFNAGEFIIGDVDGANRVEVVTYIEPNDTPNSYQFNVQIADFACVIVALNRLVRKYIPTFNPF